MIRYLPLLLSGLLQAVRKQWLMKPRQSVVVNERPSGQCLVLLCHQEFCSLYLEPFCWCLQAGKAHSNQLKSKLQFSFKKMSFWDAKYVIKVDCPSAVWYLRCRIQRQSHKSVTSSRLLIIVNHIIMTISKFWVALKQFYNTVRDNRSHNNDAISEDYLCS